MRTERITADWVFICRIPGDWTNWKRYYVVISGNYAYTLGHMLGWKETGREVRAAVAEDSARDGRGPQARGGSEMTPTVATVTHVWCPECAGVEPVDIDAETSALAGMFMCRDVCCATCKVLVATVYREVER